MAPAGDAARGYRLAEVPVSHVTIQSGFWGRRLALHRDVTLPHVIRHLYATGRVANFARAAGREPGPFQGSYGFDDSDVYKVLEGIGYVLMACPAPELQQQADRLIELIAASQEPSGYLFTQNTLASTDRRWTDMNSHEMYTGGHFIEAAVAYHTATGHPDVLAVARRLADHYLATFGPERRHWVDGHEEIGMALMRLAAHTADERYANFAHWHLEERGQGYGRGHIWDQAGFGPRYSQDHVPVKDLRAAEGHAVRAMYLASAMTDVLASGRAPEYRPALMAIWDNLVHHKMYVTGGIGAAGSIEGFGPDDVLPNREAYCETCAAIGLVYWSHRMNRLTGDAQYADVLERVLYNAVLPGWAAAGDAFFYDNPLEADGTVQRRPWFQCACCPSNVARFIPALGRYLYGVDDRTPTPTVYVNQFVESAARLTVSGRTLGLTQTTAYPWHGRIRLRLDMEAPMGLALAIRQPGWATSVRLSQGGHPLDARLTWENGYLVIWDRFNPGDEIVIDLPMPVTRVYAASAVADDRGLVALQRGPVVYCLEDADNPAGVADAACPPDALLTASPRHEAPRLGDVVTIGVVGGPSGPRLTAIPYYLWANREPGRMRVWLREQ